MRVFLLLPVAYLVGMIGVPIAYNTAMSLQEVNLGNIADFSRPFVGWENFTVALTDPVFRQVLRNSAIFVVVNVVGQVGIGTIAAACFASGFAGAHTMRGLLLAAWIIAGSRRGNGLEMDLRDAVRCDEFRFDVVRSDAPASALAVRSVDVDDRAEHRAYLVRHAVQHDPDRRRADHCSRPTV